MSFNHGYALHPIPVEQAERLRIGGGEVYVADAKPGYPCRQCLEDAEIGDEVILVSYDPFEQRSPYRSASPIFLHRASCELPEAAATLPLQLTRRQLSVRSFDSAEMMIDAAVVDGDQLDITIRGFFENAAAQQLHIHNATRGCWAVAVARE